MLFLQAMLKNCTSGVILPAAVFCLFSCNSYEKLLKSPDLELKYEKAKEYYNKKDYYRALPLFEELISVYKGTRDIEKIYYYFAYCQYGQGDYLLASYHFRNLVQTYPKSSYAEECQYMYAYCYYVLSPPYSLDQGYTQKAIESFQLFINSYPSSTRIEECNKRIDELRSKLREKAFESARLYYRLGYYKSASLAFSNILKDYPGIDNNEEVMLYVLRSDYLLAVNSIPSKKTERFEKAVQTYYAFIDRFPKSVFLKEAESIYTDCRKELKKLNPQHSSSTQKS